MCNVGLIDRALRVAGGLALIGWAVAGGPAWAWIGVIPFFTGLLEWCPLYSLIGMKTCSAK